jgi:DNA-binding beta-propeller fold protein YncE
VSRIDPDSNLVVTTIETGAGTEGVLCGGGYVWAAVTGEAHVVRIDPVDNSLGPELVTGTEPRRMVLSEGALWVTNTGDGTVSVFSLE